MQKNTEKHNALKSSFHANMEEGRQSRLILEQARALRKQARDHAGVTELGHNLLKQANDLTAQALSLRGGDRELTLALAFLNGTPYERCEAGPETAPSTRALAAHLKDCLPTEMQAEVKDIARRWLENGTLRLRDFYQEAADKATLAQQASA